MTDIPAGVWCWLCLSYCLFILLVTLNVQASPGVGLDFPALENERATKLQPLTWLSCNAPVAAEVSGARPGTFLLAYKFSVPSFFKCLLQPLASKLHISWNSVVCPLCSEDWLGVLGGCISKWV